MVFAAARIETRRRDFLAKSFAAPPLTSNEQGAIGEMAPPRNRTAALGGSSAYHTALRGLLKSIPDPDQHRARQNLQNRFVPTSALGDLRGDRNCFTSKSFPPSGELIH
jgi:hypothetical protein